MQQEDQPSVFERHHLWPNQGRCEDGGEPGVWRVEWNEQNTGIPGALDFYFKCDEHLTDEERQKAKVERVG